MRKYHFLPLLILLAACSSVQPVVNTPNGMPFQTVAQADDTYLGAPTPMPTDSPAPTSMWTPGSDLFLPNCDRAPEAGLATEISPGEYEGWYRYTNDAYGFSLAFPPEWELITGRNYICLRPRSAPTIQLIVGFRLDTEAIAIQRTGVAAGDIVTTGKVTFLGREVSRDVLRYEGKDKAVLYNYATEIDAEGLVFTVSLDDFRADYEVIELSSRIQSEGDAIVASFKLAQ